MVRVEGVRYRPAPSCPGAPAADPPDGVDVAGETDLSKLLSTTEWDLFQFRF